MPEQLGRRALPITNQPSVEPFETPVVSLGTKGLNLTDAADALQPGEYRVLTNLEHQQDGQLTVRPGTTALTAAHGIVHHSVRRLNDPSDGSFTRVYGIDTTLSLGTAALTTVDSGYSGDPLTLCPYRPPLSGETWMFVGDRSRMRKVRSDGLDLPIGLPAPSTACTSTPVAVTSSLICGFNAADAADAAQWTPNAGFDYSDTPLPTDVPQVRDFPGLPVDHIGFLTQPGAAIIPLGKGYYSFWNLAHARDLSQIDGRPSSDDDIIHLWMKMSHPHLMAEIRVYYVCSTNYSATVLPGQGIDENDEFFMHSFRGHDFAQALAARQAMVDAAETARVRDIRDADLLRRRINDDRASWEQRRAERDPARARTTQGGAGIQSWVEYGIIGVPLRRGDFQRFGHRDDRGWGTITGIVVYVQQLPGLTGPVEVYLGGNYLTGGFDPDTTEPGAQQYDYRYTHYDPRTGAEGNPSPEQAAAGKIDLVRQSAIIDPTGFGSAAIRQRIYRRGGSAIADWYFLGENSSDGGTFLDTYSDPEAIAAGGVELDNNEAVSSITTAGDTIDAQEAPIIFGPVEDLLFILGDPHRPGDVYYCKPGRPDSWPASNRTEVCSPSEELMTGGVFAGQAFALSRERLYLLYPSLTTSATTVTAVPGACTKGVVGRWAMAVGRGGIYFVAEDGLYRTTGGPEELVSRDIAPLFNNQAVGDYLAIDFAQESALRLTLHDWDLYFHYKDTAGARQVLIYSVLYSYWRAVTWPVDGLSIVHSYSDEGDGSDRLLLGGAATGVTYTRSGLTDGGAPIVYIAVTGDYAYGRPREDKLFGDLILDVDSQGQDTNLITRLNHSAVENASQLVNGGVGRARIILDSFGVLPQKARTLSVELSGTSSTAPPIFYQIGAALIPQPDVTVTRVTQWDDLGHPSEVYLTGLILDVDTADGAKEFLVEYDLNGIWETLGPFSVQADNRHKFFFSWPVVKANLVRVRPIGDCTPWMLYRADWIFDPEPPRIAGWDLNWENGWDQYVTGLDLECDTLGLEKQVQVWIDQVPVQTYAVNVLGRRVVHLTVQPPRRGHVLRAVATDANPGLLYSHRWHTDPEPSEQTNWNQNFTIEGTLGDKWLKAVLFECDTFGLDKTVTLEVDQVVVETLTVNTTGRSVVQFSFAQHLGRVFRILPTDAFPSRLYSHQLVFDQEPFKLARWETQEITHGIPGWQVPYEAHVTLKSTVDVTLTVSSYRQDGSVTSKEYLIEKTGTAKIKRYVPFAASKGVLFKYLLTASAAFWLYREETEVLVAPWGSDSTRLVHVFGNDDLDQTRGMTNATLAAARPGGGL